MASASLSKSAYRLEAAEVLRLLEVDPHNGLTQQQIQKNRAKYGRNEIPVPPGSSFFQLLLSQFEDLLVLILLGAAIISFLLACFEEGEDRLTAFVEPAVIMIILIANATVGVVQETNAEKAIEKLKESEARDANVLRQGVYETVHAAELVPGDILALSNGDKVPADARILELATASLLVDESMLTGESEAAEKFTHAINIPETQVVNQDKRNMLFSGALMLRGKATAVVVGTGSNTEMGVIASGLVKNDEKTPLQQKLDEFGEQLSKVIGVICLVVWLINIGHFTDPEHGSALRGAIYYFKIAVALAVAAIPEGLPAVVTTCLALGTMKMAKKNAIVRSLPSVETLGCTTVICSDKTGTLTTNMMSVQKVLTVDVATRTGVSFRDYLVQGDSWAPIGDIIREGDRMGTRVTAVEDGGLAYLGQISALCNEATLGYKVSEKDGTGVYTKTGAPTEAALLVLAEKIGTPTPQLNARAAEAPPEQRCQTAFSYWRQRFQREHMLEFDRDRKSMSVIVSEVGVAPPSSSTRAARNVSSGKSWLFAKGAAEFLMDRCTSIRGSDGSVVPLTAQNRAEINERLLGYERDGLRCLALAYVENPNPHNDYRDSSRYEEYESNMTFVGLTAMLDPPRAAVNASILKCRSAGIRVIVITGDNKVTAESISRKIGVFGMDEDLSGKSYTGSEFDQMNPQQKEEAARNASLFARVEPKHKLELVQLLKKQGHVVAMTGDGVNDATALKQADIGIAMGSGTDVAREASKMVLQDDNFATIVMAVEEGRAIYANTKQFIRYLISSNIGEVACIFLTAAIGMPEALIPVQLLWVNLVTDGLPATALGFNPPDKDIMLREPRGRSESIINGWMFFRYLAVGLYVGVGTVGGFIWWYLSATNGPHISWQQLVSFHECSKNRTLFEGIDCAIFHDPRPSTMSLSILVTIEMFNALNALSENQSLLSTPPTSNPYVVFACALSFALHFMIVYIPFFADIFHVAPLNQEEWLHVLYASLPVFALDEILKFISRQVSGSNKTSRTKKRD